MPTERTRPNETPTAEDVARHVSAMMDSVNLINEIIGAARNDKESLDTIERNYRHLEIMLAKDFIASSQENLAPFQPCIDSAKAYVEAATAAAATPV